MATHDSSNDRLPPPPGTRHHDDALTRRGGFTWKSFGGDGLLVSVGFHLLLAIVALFAIAKQIEKPKPSQETCPFDLPGDKGRSGDKFTANATTPKNRPPQPVTLNRPLVANTASSVTLPDTPTPDTSHFANMLTGGDVAKGVGGDGTGGDNGRGGVGPGKSPGFFGKFVPRGMSIAGMSGRFYDGKQRPDGTPSRYAGSGDAEYAANNAFGDEILRRFCGGAGKWQGIWDESFLEKTCYRAPDTLVAGSIFIPQRSANAAPEAYGVADKVKGRRWLAHYKGLVTAPKSGKFRFWGLADDVMVVRWNGRNVLDSGWTVLSLKGDFNAGNSGALGGKPVYGSDVRRKAGLGVPIAASPWIEVVKGVEYPMEFVISEVPGGLFGAWLMMEERDETTRKPDGKIFLVRFNADALPEGLVDGTGLAVDMSGKGLVWKAREMKNRAH